MKCHSDFPILSARAAGALCAKPKIRKEFERMHDWRRGRVARGGQGGLPVCAGWMPKAVGLFRFLISLYAFVMAGNCLAEAPKRKIEEKPLPVIETGLQFMSGVEPMGIMLSEFKAHWLSNRLFVVNVAQDIPNANVLKAERTMLVDAETGESRQLLETGWVVTCYSPQRKLAVIRPSPFKPTLPYKNVDQDNWQYRWIRLESDGAVSPVSDDPGLKFGSCVPREGYPPKGEGVRVLREGHGYIRLWASGQIETPEDRAFYIRPGQPPIRLENVYSTEVMTSWDQYLEFAQKYQLSYFDPQGASSTDRRLAGITWGKRPYDLTPLRFLSLDGTVEELAYPQVVRDYGIKDIGYFILTPVGLLITSNRSLMLLNGEQLTRVWGQSKGWFHTPEFVFGLKLSPDGCKLAFARTADWGTKTPKPIAILKLCQGN